MTGIEMFEEIHKAMLREIEIFLAVREQDGTTWNIHFAIKSLATHGWLSIWGGSHFMRGIFHSKIENLIAGIMVFALVSPAMCLGPPFGPQSSMETYQDHRFHSGGARL